MNWKFLPAALLPVAMAGALLIVSGCSSSRLDPSSRQKAAAESPDMMAVRRDNEALRQDQLQSQRQIEALTKQLAADREEQRRFREMMSTNFDLLEQSVSMTLAKSIDKGPGSPPSGPAGGAAAATDDPPRMSSGLAAGMASASRPAPGASNPSGYTPLVVPNASANDTRGSAKPDSRGSLADGKAAHPGTTRSTNMGALGSRSGAPLAAAAVTGSAAKQTQSGGMQTANAKPYLDPDLNDPAKPKQLTANRAAKPLYEKGFVLFGNRQYEQSILVYQNFLSRYPEDIYSDNAQFWIGEAYLRMDKLEDAEAAYRKVLREYAHKSTLEGYKTPDAIYRIGQIYAKRSNEKLARYYLQQVAQRFPDSSAGRKAVRDLEGVSQTSQVGSGDFTTGG